MDVSAHSTVIPGQGDDELRSLVAEVRSGRKAALERLLDRVQARVRRWAGRFTSDADAAEDIAQDVLIGLERRVQRFDGESRFSTWLFTVTRNVALSRRLRETRRAALIAERQHLAEDDAPDIRDPDAARLAALALRYFDALPPQQRRVFELVDIRGLTPAEVARRLSMEQSTVRGNLFKARRSIREQLLQHHERLLKEYRS
ncbi:MAG TPA: sigma-70 family RNA polymerase sigma factor [Gemmatimonadaceae bacterium]|jgi:RNA polymerase sigma-70 factor (ECF subfamily)|nr:sigma-70 family RNA polymerase sigma factor [Gemmatimonadaceae bacterium]